MSDAVGNYPPISSYAFLSDTHTAALLGPDGAVEWFCVPRFDGESVFARILDRSIGGAFELSVEGAGKPARRYLGDTLVLESRFEAPGGVATVFDFLAAGPAPQNDGGGFEARHVLVRLVRCESGSVTVRVRAGARPSYAERTAEWSPGPDGVWTSADPQMWLSGTEALEEEKDALVATAELGAGEEAVFALGYAGENPRRVEVEEAERLLEETRRTWQSWSDLCPYSGPAREHVLRSALVLRGLAFDETGALLAAPTTSLPEWIGGERNWDYRYTWHRDASLVLLALFRLGHEEEGRRYGEFLFSLDAVQNDRLVPMAGIGGEMEGEERVLDHLEGYAGSKPVRVGNEAFEQVQLETYGHVLDAAYVYQQMNGEISPEGWRVLRRLVDLIRANWREPDHGVWEMRVEKKHHTYSKIMAWVCLDRGIRLAELRGDDEVPVKSWREAREEVRKSVLENGYDSERGAFVMAYGEKALDAAVLHAPSFGFLPGDDERIVSTVERIAEELGDGEALIHRYNTSEVDDGLEGPEGAFLLSSFDLVSALVLAGRVEEAGRRFEKLLTFAGPLGLFSEEARPDGTALGNYPQAFTHLGLIQAAVNLDMAGDREALHAWAENRESSG
ncbi:Glucoamylase and related glycosyl hydrolase [Rubrobacter radiotolerans]|uniref:Glucoamylase and related glycosyl hydrolase n=1 Tax=Rubrobacter radiotolerans TaxID=42256 RepID=A0A023X632_RUBRA|nr:glycoside hydrolase family 15 protein [Rubrobacter radiotolerans]AHY47656.1 Glucoamylase and related glycosyl hydrolase [Rubrobacter radiotolerans]MDX5895059.1 glycoside hydrolase family 15 protein [Rubrobacter radiotolerans]SMC07364.1 Glucoamylase (glucan-1,4-alpha-glucosidase), GH15 family [Rubrobacter radiotolerans DSM 5868]